MNTVFKGCFVMLGLATAIFIYLEMFNIVLLSFVLGFVITYLWIGEKVKEENKKR